MKCPCCGVKWKYKTDGIGSVRRLTEAYFCECGAAVVMHNMAIVIWPLRWMPKGFLAVDLGEKL